MSALLFVHVALGGIAVFVGAVAFSTRKGATMHVRFGRWFSVAMVASSVLGAVLGAIDYDQYLITVFGAVLSITLIVGGVQTVRDGTKPGSPIAYGSAGRNGLNATAIIVAGAMAKRAADSELLGFPAEDYFFLAGMALVALVGDIAYFLKRNTTSRHRVARHLWRMSLGFFIAAGSAFTGPGMSAYPMYIQESGVLFLPELIILMTMMFWFIKVRFSAQSVSHHSR